MTTTNALTVSFDPGPTQARLAYHLTIDPRGATCVSGPSPDADIVITFAGSTFPSAAEWYDLAFGPEAPSFLGDLRLGDPVGATFELPPLLPAFAVKRAIAPGIDFVTRWRFVDTPFGSVEYHSVFSDGALVSNQWHRPAAGAASLGTVSIECDYVDLLRLLVGEYEVRDLLEVAHVDGRLPLLSVLAWIYEADESIEYWAALNPVLKLIAAWSECVGDGGLTDLRNPLV